MFVEESYQLATEESTLVCAEFLSRGQWLPERLSSCKFLDTKDFIAMLPHLIDDLVHCLVEFLSTLCLNFPHTYLLEKLTRADRASDSLPRARGYSSVRTSFQEGNIVMRIVAVFNNDGSMVEMSTSNSPNKRMIWLVTPKKNYITCLNLLKKLFLRDSVKLPELIHGGRLCQFLPLRVSDMLLDFLIPPPGFLLTWRFEMELSLSTFHSYFELFVPLHLYMAL